MKVFSKDGELQCWSEVLPFAVVHGIRPAEQRGGECETEKRGRFADSSSSIFVLVYGQKWFRVLEIGVEDQGKVKIVPVCEVVHLADWLLDVTWLDWKDPSNYTVAAVTAHNVLVKHQLANGEPVSTRYQSEVSCMLYPGYK